MKLRLMIGLYDKLYYVLNKEDKTRTEYYNTLQELYEHGHLAVRIINTNTDRCIKEIDNIDEIRELYPEEFI